MQPIQYTLNLQRIFLLLMALSIFGLVNLLLLVNPYSEAWAVWLLWALVWIILSGIQLFGFFWWYFFVKSQILTIVQVNTLLYQSLVGGMFGVLLLVLIQTEQLNYFNGGIMIASYTAYTLFWRG